jgi:peptidoglycan hydrolase CwlO-like protein
MLFGAIKVVDNLKNYVSRTSFLAMVGLVIAMSIAVYVRHEKNSERVVITNYRISQLENENKNIQKKIYVLEKSLETLLNSLDADGHLDGTIREGE